MINWPWEYTSESVSSQEDDTEELCYGYGRIMGKQDTYIVDDKDAIIDSLSQYNPNENGISQNLVYRFNLYNNIIYANTLQMETRARDKTFKGEVHGQD